MTHVRYTVTDTIDRIEKLVVVDTVVFVFVLINIYLFVK